MKKFNYLGPVLIFLHSSLTILIILTILFSNDILNLLILLFILKLILFANYQCNDCPISTIEDNYSKHGAEIKKSGGVEIYLKKKYLKD